MKRKKISFEEHFFKELKPKITSKLIYFKKVKKLEINMPTGTPENFYEYYKEEKPLAIAAAAMAVGAAIGLAIPSSRYEGELMGEASENLRAKAEDTASELVDKAKQVASDASQAVTKEIGSQTNAPRNA